MNNLKRITLVLCLPIMMACIDVMALSVALDAIVKEFKTPIYQTQWLFSAYMIASSSFLIATGHLADMYGKRRMLLLGIWGFTLSSVVAASSYNFWLLVIARGFQGLTSAAIMVASIALITSNFTSPVRSHLLTRWMFSVGMGLAFGPIVGGLLVNFFDWRLIFLVNIPIGIISYLGVQKYVAESPPKEVAEQPKLINAFLISITITILAIFLTEGSEWGWFSKASLLTCFVFTASLILFIYFEMNKSYSIVNVYLFRKSSFIISILSGFFSYFFMYAWLFIFSLYLQEVRGLTSLIASFICVSYSIAFAFCPLALNKYFTNLDNDNFITISFFGVFLAFLGMSFNPISASLFTLMVEFFLLGLSISTINVSSMIVATQSVSKEMAGSVSGIIFTVRWLGGAIGVVIATIIYHSIAIYNLTSSLSNSKDFTLSSTKLSNMLFSNHIVNIQKQYSSHAELLILKIKQALSYSITVTFLVLAVLSFLCLITVSQLQLKSKNK